MFKYISIVLLLIFTSCNQKESWLTEYQKAKCEWENLETKFKIDSIQQNKGLSEKLQFINNQLTKEESVSKAKMEVLEQKIKIETEAYFKKENELSDAQTMKYGHLSTPEFEKNLSQLEKSTDSKILIYKTEIAKIQKALNNQPTVQKLTAQKESILNQIKDLNKSLKEKLKPNFDKLQEIINNKNLEFKSMEMDMTDEDKQNFNKQKEEIRKNPCKHITK